MGRTGIIAQLVREPYVLGIGIRRIFEVIIVAGNELCFLLVSARIAEYEPAWSQTVPYERVGDVEDLSNFQPSYAELAQKICEDV